MNCRNAFQAVINFLVVLYIFLPINLQPDGFVPNTLVALSLSKQENYPIKLLCEDFLDEKQLVCSFDTSKNKCIKRKITSAATAEINCFIAIRFNDEPYDDIICSPSQEFYSFDKRHWVPAYQLQIGDCLFNKNKSAIRISDIRFNNSSLTVYSIRVGKTHNFFVGRYEVLTHNMLLPAITVGIGAAFGSGAIAGGSAASFLGPVTCAAGILLGGFVGMVTKAIFSRDKLPHYEISYNPQNFADVAKDSTKAEKKNIQMSSGSCGGAAGPEDPNDWWKRKKNDHNKNKKFKEDNVNQTSTAILKNGYYEVNGFKFTYYYNYLWTHGRSAPSLSAEAILNNPRSIIPDPRGHLGFYKYVADGWEMIYNPVTKIVSHIQQIG